MANEMEMLRSRCAGCMSCPLGATRRKLVFGVGRSPSEVMFIGEGPGEQEDLQGEPFVGPAGKLLDDMLSRSRSCGRRSSSVSGASPRAN